MENSTEVGIMAVVAVSGISVLLVHQVHKYIHSNFMKELEFELHGILHSHGHKKLAGSVKQEGKKKVRFAEDVLEPSSNNKEYRRRCIRKARANAVRGNLSIQTQPRSLQDTMPLNRVVLYKGMLEFKTLKRHIYV